jgi:RNA polymerase sigma-70 factor (ECF subfamily)
MNHELAYHGLFKNPENLYDHFDDKVHKALLGLTEAERMILLLRSIGEFTYREIADLMEMPMGTVMANLCRGREKMRWKLTAYARQIGWQPSQLEERP